MKVVAEVSSDIPDGLGPVESNTSLLSNKSNQSVQSVHSEKSIKSNHTEISVNQSITSILSEQSESGDVIATISTDVQVNQSNTSIKSNQSDKTNHIQPTRQSPLQQKENLQKSVLSEEHTQQNVQSENTIQQNVLAEKSTNVHSDSIITSINTAKGKDSVPIIPLDHSPRLGPREQRSDSDTVVSPRSLPDHFFTRHTPELRKKGFEERAL